MANRNLWLSLLFVKDLLFASQTLMPSNLLCSSNPYESTSI